VGFQSAEPVLDHFVTCHRAVIALLDAACALGMAVEVRDDSGYWDHRDERRLVESAEYWSALVAPDAPVFRHPEFERLEMDTTGCGGARALRRERRVACSSSG
jgi:hypothetical protein